MKVREWRYNSLKGKLTQTVWAYLSRGSRVFEISKRRDGIIAPLAQKSKGLTTLVSALRCVFWMWTPIDKTYCGSNFGPLFTLDLTKCAVAFEHDSCSRGSLSRGKKSSYGIQDECWQAEVDWLADRYRLSHMQLKKVYFAVAEHYLLWRIG